MAANETSHSASPDGRDTARELLSLHRKIQAIESTATADVAAVYQSLQQATAILHNTSSLPPIDRIKLTHDHACRLYCYFCLTSGRTNVFLGLIWKYS